MSPPKRTHPSPDPLPGKRLRLFAAVDLGAELIDRVHRLTTPLHAQAPNARWASPDGMHLTLFFFGSVSLTMVAPLQDALGRAAEGHGPLRLRVQGSGGFGTLAHPRVLWLGLQGDLQPLAALQASVTGQVSALGFEAEHRAFSPHLTLARAKAPRGDPALAACRDALRTLDAGEAQVDALVLYRSEPSPQGSRYTALQRYPLRHAR